MHLRPDDLRELVLLQLEATSQLSWIESELGQRGVVDTPRVHRCGGGRALSPEASERVEQLALPALVEKPLLVVLPVNLHETPRHARQASGRHRLVVDPGGGPPRRRNLPHADQRLRSPIEECLHAGRLGPVAHQRSVCARPDSQPQGIDEQTLAGAGFSCEHVQPRLEGDPQLLDEGQIVDRKLRQSPGGHGSGRARFGARNGDAIWAGIRAARVLVRPTTSGFADLRRRGLGHEGSNSDFWRSRSQNGMAPRGSMKRIGRGISDTQTTSPTESRRSSRPSTLMSTSYASRTRTRTVCRGLTTTDRMAER